MRIGSGFTPRGSLRLLSHAVGGGTGNMLITAEFSGGFGYRWRPRFVQTYVGVALHGRTRANALGDRTGRYAIVTLPDGTQDTSPLDTAIGVEANIDIVTPRIPALFFRLGGSAAIYQSATRTCTASSASGTPRSIPSDPAVPRGSSLQSASPRSAPGSGLCA